MKIKTLAIASLLSAGLATSTASFSNNAEDEWVDIYGKIMLSMDNIDFTINGEKEEGWRLVSHATRFGIKGQGKAGSLEAFYKIEWQIDPVDASKSSSDHLKSRNQIVGVRGAFGEVFAGRHDSPTKKLQRKIDLFNDFYGDIAFSFNGEIRADNIIQYSTPKMGGFQFRLAAIPGEDTANNNDGFADATSFAAEYTNGKFYIGLSNDQDYDGEGIDTTRIVSQYNVNDWQFGILFQETDVMGNSADGFLASVKYKHGKNDFKLQTADSDIWELNDWKASVYSSTTSLGWDYNIGKKTAFTTFYTMGERGDTGDDESAFGVGIIQKF